MVHDSNAPNSMNINLFTNLGAIIEQMAEHNPGNPEAEIERLRALIRRNEEESQARIQALEAENQQLRSAIQNPNDDTNSSKFTSFLILTRS